MNNNLSNLGYRMPAEWEKQESIWITWPYNKEDWPDLFESIPKKVAEIVSIISKTQKVNLIIKLNEKENKIIPSFFIIDFITKFIYFLFICSRNLKIIRVYFCKR